MEKRILLFSTVVLETGGLLFCTSSLVAFDAVLAGPFFFNDVSKITGTFTDSASSFFDTFFSFVA